MSFFSVSGLCAGYGNARVLSGVSFGVERGSLTGVIGANGSGKTTLLKAICGILPHEGECLLEGVSLESLSPRKLAKLVSYIPQRSGISIDISVLDVVLMGFNPRLRLLERPSPAMVSQAMEALSLVGLEGKEQSNYLTLSEGQKQLCILARTLVSGSQLLLLDEPESALDFRFRCNMLILLRRLTADKQSAALVTLHDPMLALNHCDQLLMLQDGGITDILRPQSNSIRVMEDALSRIYGSVSLHAVQSRNGKKQLVMLREDES